MNLFAHLRARISSHLEDMVRDGFLPGELANQNRFTVEPPRDSKHGEVTTNAAMLLAKPARMAPRVIAEELARRLLSEAEIAAADIAGPGFINLRLVSSFWGRVLAAILDEGERYGSSNIGAGLKTNVEYVSANPTGPLHVGHCRGAIFGDALAALLEEVGFDVTREYYINDAGGQVNVLAHSAYLRYREACGEEITIAEGLYPGSYLKSVGEALKQKYGTKLLDQNEAEWLPHVRELALAMMMDLIRADLATLNIRQDVFFSERTLHASDRIATSVDNLRDQGLIYQGRLPPPKGQLPPDWEDREQSLFKATDFGDDIDRALMKSNGEYTYFAADVAYANDKLARGFKQLFFILGADHSGYVKRLQAITRALSDNQAQAIVLLCQLVKLSRNGEPLTMSKRAGAFVTLREVVNEVGADVTRFTMLYRKNDAPLEFDFAAVMEKSRDNPVFYVQYAHARICSVFRTAGETIGPKCIELAELQAADASLLCAPAELAVLRKMGEYPRLIEAAAGAHEPHKIAFYLYELASEFHGLWNLGKESPDLRFISHTAVDVTQSRLALLRGIQYVIANGLRILGVRPVDEM